MPGLQAILVVIFFVIVTCYLLYKDHTSKDMLEFKHKERTQISTLETRNSELLEAVKKAHEILLHEVDKGRTPSMLQGVGLGYFEDVIAGID